MHVYLTQMNRGQLVQAYNNLTGQDVNKFESHKVGCRRLTAAVEELVEGAKGGEGIIYMPGDVKFDDKTLTFKQGKITSEEAIKQAKVHLGEPSDPAPVPKTTERKRKPGVIAAIRAELDKNPDAGVDDILPILVKKFPAREPKSMTTTIRIQRSRYKKENAS